MSQRTEVKAPAIVLDRFPDRDGEAWERLIRDVIGGGSAVSELIGALDRPVGPLLEGVDVEAALAAADEPQLSSPDWVGLVR